MALGQFPAHRRFAVSEFTAYRIERRWQSARRLEENKRRLDKSQRFQALARCPDFAGKNPSK